MVNFEGRQGTESIRVGGVQDFNCLRDLLGPDLDDPTTRFELLLVLTANPH